MFRVFDKLILLFSCYTLDLLMPLNKYSMHGKCQQLTLAMAIQMVRIIETALGIFICKQQILQVLTWFNAHTYILVYRFINKFTIRVLNILILMKKKFTWLQMVDNVVTLFTNVSSELTYIRTCICTFTEPPFGWVRSRSEQNVSVHFTSWGYEYFEYWWYSSGTVLFCCELGWVEPNLHISA